MLSSLETFLYSYTPVRSNKSLQVFSHQLGQQVRHSHPFSTLELLIYWILPGRCCQNPSPTSELFTLRRASEAVKTC